MKATIDVVLLCISDWTQGKAPRPEDVATVDGVVKASYEVVSGPAGQPRDWDRDRTLYVPGVKFVAMGEKDGKPVAEVMPANSTWRAPVTGWRRRASSSRRSIARHAASATSRISGARRRAARSRTAQ